jgi:hypothetical protein
LKLREVDLSKVSQLAGDGAGLATQTWVTPKLELSTKGRPPFHFLLF